MTSVTALVYALSSPVLVGVYLEVIESPGLAVGTPLSPVLGCSRRNETHAARRRVLVVGDRMIANGGTTARPPPRVGLSASN